MRKSKPASRSAAKSKAAAKAPAPKPANPSPATPPGPPVASSGFVFADPTSTPDDFTTLPKADVYADTAATPNLAPEPFPAPWKNPPVLALGDILGPDAVAQIGASGSLVLHCFGDSGGVKSPAAQFAVADAIAAELAGKTYATGRSAFLYHLGDVVYYFGQERYYYDQFYDPYHNYDAPIFAIPGNHDGVMFPGEQATYSLEGFCNNFCAQTSAHSATAQGFARTTMTQPGVFFTLQAPFLRVIGLYTNTGEGQTSGVLASGTLGNSQLDFLNAQLAAAAADRKSGQVFALAIATHHPPFTASSGHAPSPQMLQQIDAACAAAGILPDIHLSGHAHLYERFTRTLQGHAIPYLVVGTGGYYNLSGAKTDAKGQPTTVVRDATDASGNPLGLASSTSTNFGYLRLTVSAAEIQGQFITVAPQGGAHATFDSFTVNLNAHTVTTP